MEDFGYLREEKKKFPELLRKIFLVSATLLSIICFIYITFTAYDFVYNNQNKNIETIKSPEDPIKVTSKSLAEKDETKKINSSIYDDIFGSTLEPTAKVIPKVHLAPEPAFPPKKEKVDVITQELEPNTRTQVARSNTYDKRIVVYTDQPETSDNSKDLLTKGITQTNNTATANKRTSTRGLINVQIAALTSRNSVDNYWRELNRLNPALFSGLKLYTQTVDLGKRGVFYRVQIGNFSDQIEAEEFCNRYISKSKKSRADCIVVE